MQHPVTNKVYWFKGLYDFSVWPSVWTDILIALEEVESFGGSESPLSCLRVYLTCTTNSFIAVFLESDIQVPDFMSISFNI